MSSYDEWIFKENCFVKGFISFLFCSFLFYVEKFIVSGFSFNKN